jgi:hypothetical protein
MRPNNDTGGVEFESVEEVRMAKQALRVMGFNRLALSIDGESRDHDWLSLGPLESDLVIQGLKRQTTYPSKLYTRVTDADSRLAGIMLGDYSQKSSSEASIS